MIAAHSAVPRAQPDCYLFNGCDALTMLFARSAKVGDLLSRTAGKLGASFAPDALAVVGRTSRHAMVFGTVEAPYQRCRRGKD